MKFKEEIFKAYDVRGRFPKEINPPLFNAIAQELALFFQPQTAAIGRDMRPSSKKLTQAMIEGLVDQGVNVIDLGLITSDMIYFAAGKYKWDLNIIVTGSHAEGENGFKVCQKGALAISGESGLDQIRDKLKKRKNFPSAKTTGQISQENILQPWLKFALSFIDLKKIEPFKGVIDTGNGMASLVVPGIIKSLPGKYLNLFPEIDGTFPHHFPNPLIEKNLYDLKKKIKATKADFGLAFDADGDRAFFLDEQGQTVSGSALTALIAKAILLKHPGETILYNVICSLAVPEIIKENKGKPVRVRVGHSPIKQKMRQLNAIFAGEHSGHFYFRENYYADSGLIAVLKAIELFSQDQRKLSAIVKEVDRYADSGEINFQVTSRKKIIQAIKEKYEEGKQDTLDGITITYSDYWFNLRPSNTEPLIRLNLEAKNEKIMKNKLKDVIKVIEALGGKRK
jgi:phosphomannomutase